MKKLLQSVALAATALSVNTATAQIPDNGVCPAGIELVSYQPVAAYTGNHIYDMGTWKIDSLLDAGKVVILDMFGTWCPPCWTYHSGHELNNLYDSQGWGGTDDVAIFAVDASSNANNFEFITSANSGQGDWINDTKYPMVDNSSLASTFNVGGFPTLVAICPDRTVTKITRTSNTASNVLSVISGCGSLSTNTNDPRILMNQTELTHDVCQETSKAVDIKVTIQNYSTTAINGTYTVKVFDSGSTEVASQDVNLNLAAYAAVEETIGSVTISSGANAYTVEITTTNDDATNDDLAISIDLNVAPTFPLITSGFGEMTIDIDITSMDNYAQEFGMFLKEGTPSGTLVSEYNSSTVANTIGYTPIGTMSNGTTTYNETYTADNLGCHYFGFVDYYSDGLGNSSNIAITGNNQTVNVSGDYDGGQFLLLDLTDGGAPVSVEESENVDFAKVFPNPAIEMTNVQFFLNSPSQVTVEVLNAVGQKVFVNNLGEVNGLQNVEVTTEDLAEGVYLVNINVNGDVLTKRISVVK